MEEVRLTMRGKSGAGGMVSGEEEVETDCSGGVGGSCY